MSATAVTKTELTLNAAAAMPAASAVDATDGALVTYDKADQKILLVLENANTTATATAVVNKGNGLQGVSDLEVTLAASAKKCVVVESGRFINVSGDNKGKIRIDDKATGGTDIKVAAVVLP